MLGAADVSRSAHSAARAPLRTSWHTPPIPRSKIRAPLRRCPTAALISPSKRNLHLPMRCLRRELQEKHVVPGDPIQVDWICPQDRYIELDVPYINGDSANGSPPHFSELEPRRHAGSPPCLASSSSLRRVDISDAVYGFFSQPAPASISFSAAWGSEKPDVRRIFTLGQRSRTFRASSSPFIPGIATSLNRSATSCPASSSFNASIPFVASITR